MRLYFLPILLAFFISGCVHIEHYPESWEKIKSVTHDDNCPTLKNTYLNSGEKPDGTKVLLAVWLAPELSKKTKEDRSVRRQIIDNLFHADTVNLELIDNKLLTVRATGDGIDHRWVYEKSKGEFECKDGMIRIPKGGDMSGDNVAAFGSGSDDIYITENYVVINSHGGTAGIVLLIPMAGYGSDWARFRVK